MKQTFDSPFVGKPLLETIRNPNIIAGRHSYYSGYYHGHSFDDCARFLSAKLRDDLDRLLIGAFVSIGSGAVFIMAGNQGHRHDWVSTFPFHYWDDFKMARDGWQPAGDTVVGNDVWIGSEAKIMPGITIGDGAVIGAGAVITKDVDPYAIVGGNPGKPIRFRFAPKDIGHLLEMQWWTWNDDDIRKALPLLTSGDIGALYRFWKSDVI